ALQKYDENNDNIKRSLKRFSKREKKEYKKKESSDMLRPKNVDLASHLYKEVPQTTFTRTISNPEIVMKKRREKNLLNKLKEIGHAITSGASTPSFYSYGYAICTTVAKANANSGSCAYEMQLVALALALANATANS
uniref:Uncharacterized protein n=1 Tax=Acrobeloides nanus TaxID=290746 RepID=A0A914DBS0_9BILA